MRRLFLNAHVRSLKRITPSMIRVDFHGGELDRFQTNGFSDEWVRLIFPPEDGSSVALPFYADGKWQQPDGSKQCPSRPYTVRKWTPEDATITVDFVVHDGGVAASWAGSARIGDRIGLGCSDGRFDPMDDADWFLLLSDITGLPAVGRILEELPAGKRAIAHVEVPHGDDRQEIDSRADVSTVWYETFPKKGKYARLEEIAKTIRLPAGKGRIWIAGEATAVSEGRKHFRDALGFDKNRITSVGYWIKGQVRG